MVIRKAKYMIAEFITGVKTQYNNGIACGYKILTDKIPWLFFSNTRARKRCEKRKRMREKKTIALCLQYVAHGRLYGSCIVVIMQRILSNEFMK